jgi:hypothetical protein
VYRVFTLHIRNVIPPPSQRVSFIPIPSKSTLILLCKTSGAGLREDSGNDARVVLSERVSRSKLFGSFGLVELTG